MSDSTQFPYCRSCNLPLQGLFVETSSEFEFVCPGCDFKIDPNTLNAWMFVTIYRNAGESFARDLADSLTRQFGEAAKVNFTYEFSEEFLEVSKRIVLRRHND